MGPSDSTGGGGGGASELWDCVNAPINVGLGSHFLSHSSPSRVISHAVSVDVKHDEKRRVCVRAQELYSEQADNNNNKEDF